VKTLRMLSAAVALLLSASAARAQAPTENPFKFEFHGWVTGSLYYQDQAFASAQGQGLLLGAPSVANETGGAVAPASGSVFSGDIRNSRFSFGVTGPAVAGGTPRGYLELDLFGPFNSGAFGTDQAIPRIRVAIAELKLGSTVIQVGQQNQLIVPQIPASIAHIANPLPFGAGLLGWRTPGVRVLHTLPFGPAKLELAAEVVKNKWNDTAQAIGGQNDPRLFSLGEASGLPMVQGRVKADGKMGDITYSAYLVGMWHQISLKGFGDNCTTLPPTGPPANACQPLPASVAGDDTLSGYSAELGGRVVFAPLTVAANVYVGKANGNVLGSIVQFGDIADLGGWANVGFNVTKEFSIWGLYGFGRPDEDDVREWGQTRLANDVYGAMIRYAASGYQVGVEGYQMRTKYSTGATTDTTNDALQVIGSVGYFF
jgi:hypothetical protein